MCIIEIILLLSTLLPIFHLINAIFTKKKETDLPAREEKRFSILIPCFNEECIVQASIRGLLEMNYTCYEAIYINDGSQDHTFEILCEELDLQRTDRPVAGEGIRNVFRSRIHPHIYVIDKENSGKGECLNAGISMASCELIVTLDADSVLHKEALRHINCVFEDRKIAAAGGTIHIAQGYDNDYLNKSMSIRKRLLISLQVLDYLKGFYIYKMSLFKQRASIVISGAFGVFRKEVLEAAKGFRKTLGEDIDITLRIQRVLDKTQKVVYLPEALCYTQCPENWADLIKQRMRWQKGFINCLIYNGKYLLKTFLYKILSFHMLIEAVVVGLSSCFYALFTLGFVFVLLFGDASNLINFALYLLIRVCFCTLYSVGAVVMSRKYNRYPAATMKRMPLIILIDMVLFWLFNVIIYLAGTASYIWSPQKNNDWNKVERYRRPLMIELNARPESWTGN
jgi:poly-beta-1,6-N-acetyl-D-glucosamine synthase